MQYKYYIAQNLSCGCSSFYRTMFSGPMKLGITFYPRDAMLAR